MPHGKGWDPLDRLCPPCSQRARPPLSPQRATPWRSCINMFSSCIPAQIKNAVDHSTLGQLCPLWRQRICPPPRCLHRGELTIDYTSICVRRVFTQTEYGQLFPQSLQRTAPPPRCLHSGELRDDYISVCLRREIAKTRYGQLCPLSPQQTCSPPLLSPQRGAH